MDTLTQSPQERLTAALEAFEHEQGLLPAGVQGFNLPDISQPAAVNALITLLVQKGVMTHEEFNDGQLLQRAVLVEDLVRQARELKRQHSGLVMPGRTTV